MATCSQQLKHEKTEDFTPVTADMPGYKACKVIEIKPGSISAKSDLGQNVPDKIKIESTEGEILK